MAVGYNITFFILALTILIAVHEWGHFIAARMVGVKVLRFSIGFGRPLFKYMGRKGTEYILAWVPLGGYVKMLDEDEGDVESEELDKAFNRKPVWARLFVVLAGPALNFVFAIFAFWLMFVIGIKSLAPIIGNVEPASIASQASLQIQDEIIKVGEQPVRSWQEFQQNMMPYLGSERGAVLTIKNTQTGMLRTGLLPTKFWLLDPLKPDLLKSLGISAYVPLLQPVIGNVIDNLAAQKSGLRAGDTVVTINQEPINYWHQMLKIVQDNGSKKLVVDVLRNEKLHTLTIYPQLKTYNGRQIGFIGASVQKQNIVDDWLRNQKFSAFVSLKMALAETKKFTITSLTMIWKFISAQISVRNIGGPIGIAEGAGQSASIGFSYYLSFLALISISLGVINLLPVPMLDGGHALFYFIEMVAGRPVPSVIREKCLMVGMALLGSLMMLAMFNDITRLVHAF